MLEAGEISKEDYDKWSYQYPEFDIPGHSKSMIPYQKRIDEQRLDLKMKVINNLEEKQIIKHLLQKNESGGRKGRKLICFQRCNC